MKQKLKPVRRFTFLRNFILTLLIHGLGIVIMDIVTVYNLHNRIEQQKERDAVPDSRLDSDETENNLDQTKELSQ
jgi:hypothetical protein